MRPRAIVTLYDAEGNGRDVDVTNMVADMYDALLSSMDWGSGFLDTEQITSILAVGKALGFDMPGEIGGVRPGYRPTKETWAAFQQRAKEWTGQVFAMAENKLTEDR